jgi:MYXO-CTERM domain-containing protein
MGYDARPSRTWLGAALLGAVIGVGLLAAPAAAQTFKPRILVVFDTSGSMGFDVESGLETFGDNSNEYPGNGGISRLFAAKEAIRSIVETTSEVEFGLLRYPQIEGDGINDGNGRQQFNTYDGLAENPLNYAGFCDGRLRPQGEDPFSLIVPFGDDNEIDILSWMNHREDWPADKELRAEGPTPIAESLSNAREYFADIMADDPGLRCRNNYVVLLTDGAESCVPRDDARGVLQERTLALREIAVNTPQGMVRKDVKLFIVAFAVNARDVVLLDDLARIGGTAVNDQGETDLFTGGAFEAENQAGLRAAFSEILAQAIPQEACNGEDDDCDGRIDEGSTNACGSCGPAPLEVCNGEDDDCDGLVDESVRNRCGGCGAVPVEVCNGADDDCDGAVDEAVVNNCGGCAEVQREVCNGIDDDCDGFVDNAPGVPDPLSRACGSDVGACERGAEVCRGGMWEDCDGVPAVDEICDGLDNDCDGNADEVTRACGPAAGIGNVGVCRVGVQGCGDNCDGDPESCDEDGWSTTCRGATGPSDEVCDGRDNDCDGASDEALFNACGLCGPTPPEVCNGVDDNCDGRVDEDAQCPRGYLCFVGECVQRCDATGECPGGFTCVEVYPGAGGRFCHPDPCAGARCPAGFVCDSESAACVDPCAGVDCGGGESCELGECVPTSCRHEGCPDGQICRGDRCEADPCAGVDCGEDAYCRGGQCAPVCRDVDCGEGRACIDGECTADPCGGRCLLTQLCDPEDGACYEDPCARVTCPDGTACLDGECSEDGPCLGITCPGGSPPTQCVNGRCTDGRPGVLPDLTSGPVPTPSTDAGMGGGAGGGGGQMGPPTDAGPPPGNFADVALPGAEPEPDTGPPATTGTSGDSGCGCGTHDGAPSPWWAAIGLLALARIRRRRR